MMELRHMTMVNWHLFDAADVEVGGHIGVLGENRSGKSTVLDMAQVVLTGGNRRFQRLNAVAGDSGKSRGASRRSVLDYCLGTLGEDQQRRTDARTYIALGFEDAAGLRPPVTIGMALEAHKSDAKETVLALFVAVGGIFSTADFTEKREGQIFPAQWEDVRSRIIAKVGEENFKNHRDKAGDYVREYMRYLLPHVPSGEQNASSLQKSIVNAMTLDHNQTATEFVRNYILEVNPIRIGELRESIQTYRNINVTIRKMRERLESLKVLRTILNELEVALEAKFREQWIARRADWLAARAANRDFKVRLRTEEMHSAAAADELKFLSEDIAAIEREIERLVGAIADHDSKTGRNALLQALRVAEQTSERAKGDFHKRRDLLRKVEPLCALRGSGFDEHIPDLERLVSAAKDAALESMQEGAASVEQGLAASFGASLAAVDKARQRLIKRLVEHRERKEEIEALLSAHSHGSSAAYLDPATELLCRKLRQSGMAPRVLCDLVELADTAWTAAAEGLLGRDREAVFVDRKDIAAATAIFKEGRRDFRGASLVSLNKLEQHRHVPSAGTFPTIFRSSDLDVMSFIMRRYGNVRLAGTLAEFDAPGRAIMMDGLYDDGLLRSHRSVNVSTYKIGKGAQALAVHALREEAEGLEDLILNENLGVNAVDAAHGALRSIFASPSETLAGFASLHSKARGDASDADMALKALDGSGDGGLRIRKKAQEDLKATRKKEQATQQTALVKHQSEMKYLRSMLAGGDGASGSDFNARIAWSLLCKQLPLYDVGKGRASYRSRLDASAVKGDIERHRAIAAHAKSAVDEADRSRNSIERRIRDALSDYFEIATVSSQVGIESDPLNEVKPWMTLLIEDIESNELRQYERQAREAAEKAATLLRGQFINALTSRISKMDRDLQSLTRALEDHPFHNERYSFHRTRVVDFQPILKIVEIAKTSPEALDMLFRADVPDDFPHKDTIQALQDLLEDPDKNFAEFEDYRNFYTFEIQMEDVVSGRKTRWEARRGTGSGAEQQVPIYVAIGASLASVYGSADPRSGKPTGMAIAMFDEAFSKMDGRNQRQMMSFYKNLGLQIIIAAPFEKRVAVLEHMDTIVEVDRIGEQSRATVVVLKQMVRDELMAIDPDRMTDDDLAGRLAAE